MSAWVRCSLCHRQLNDPRLLPCSHTYCLSCLESACDDGKITCPQCSTQHAVNPAALPSNILVKQYLEKLPQEEVTTQESTQEAPKPQMCDSEDGKEATKWCERCDSMLCDQCWDVAHSVGKLKTHQPKPVIQGVADGPENCAQHSHKNDFYCSTCSLAICHICWIEEHKNHEVSSLSQSAEQVKQDLLKPCAAVLNNRSILVKKVNKQNASVQLLQAKLKALEVKVEAVRNQLEQTVREKGVIQQRHDQVESVHHLLVANLENLSPLDLVEKKDTLYADLQRLYELIYDEAELPQSEASKRSSADLLPISSSATDVIASPAPSPPTSVSAESSDAVLPVPRVNPKLVTSTLRSSPSPKTLRSTPKPTATPTRVATPSRSKTDTPKREVSVPIIWKESKPSPIVSEGVWTLNPDSIKGAEHSYTLEGKHKLVKKDDGHTAITCLEGVKDGRYKWKIKFFPTKPGPGENWLLVGIQRKSQALSHSSHGEPDTYGWTVNHQSQTNGSWFGGRFTKMGTLLMEEGGILTLEIDCNGEELILSGADWSRRTDIPSSPQGYYLHLNAFSASFEILSCELLK